MRPPDRREFSHRTRAYNLARLRAEQFDILVIGGGITGSGIARDAALRGYKVALVERNDFASGTSSQSSKLIHGGVRYLEHFQLHLVYEASRERRRLLGLAPNHVWPLPFTYPIYRGARYGPFLVNIGLWMYDALGLFRNVETHRMLSPLQISKQIPGLDVSDIVGGAQYYDAQTDDARLTLETVRSAHRHGALVANHVQVEGFTCSDGVRIDGATVRDLFSGEVINVPVRVIVNATGPWTDSILSLDAHEHKRRLRPTKGIHLLVPRKRFPVSEAVAFTVKDDGRLMFVLPRGEFIMIGTTDTDWQGDPDFVQATSDDVEYVLRAVRGAFPTAYLQREDILSTYAGLRPLLAPKSGVTSGAISREHEIWMSTGGLVNIAGGKLTTYRSMAQQVVDRVARILAHGFDVRPSSAPRTAQLALAQEDGQLPAPTRAEQELLKTLTPATTNHLGRAYGLRSRDVLRYVFADPMLASPIVDGLPYIWAEVPHAVEREMACSVSDVMMRRLDLFHEVPDGAVAAAHEVARYMGRLLGWIDPDVETEVAAYADAVRLNRESLKAPSH